MYDPMNTYKKLKAPSLPSFPLKSTFCVMTSLNPKPPNLHISDICKLLVSSTHARSLPKGLQLHAHVIKSGLDSLPIVTHHLINLYSKLHLPLLSLRLFAAFPSKSSTTWSSLLSSFSHNHLPLLALAYFRRLLALSIRPDDRIFPTITKSCALLARAEVGQSVHCLAFKSGYNADVFVASSLVDMYAKCGEVRDARHVFDEMPYRNVVTFGGMISGYVQAGEGEAALVLFKRALLIREFDVNDFTLSSVVRVCGGWMMVGLGRQVHGLCFKTSFDSSSFLGSALVSLYAKCGVIEEAYQVFDEATERNVGIWNAMMIACAQHVHTERTFELFEEMERSGMKPNFITFLCVLYACSHAGLVEKGRHYFQLMKEYGIEPGESHYASLVDLLGRAGKLQDAVKVTEEMPFEPTESVLGALLTGCRLHGDTELAASVADKIFALGSMSSGMHVLVSNAYAAAGRFEEAAKARKRLRDHGVKKETGLSWVEEENKIHTFAAGDRTHVKTEEIYQKLKELGDEMEKAGYVADTSFVLRDVNNEEKNQTIRYHSERLAVAFGLLTIPPDRPIRIMKNLRICGDCHIAIKFMSKCSGRVIIVRDNNRFHRFEDGKCTCGDYW